MAMIDYADTIRLLESFVRSECRESLAKGQNTLSIKEDGYAAQGRLSKVTIEGFNNVFCCFFPDKATPEFSPFLTRGKAQKACDSIIFTEYKGHKYILICELKSGSTSGVTTQLKNTSVIVDMLKSLCKRHEGVELNDWDLRYVVIKNRALKKSKFRKDQTPVGLSPERPHEISVKNNSTLQLGRVCKPIT